MDKVTIHTLKRLKQAGQRITMVTAYDATFARILDDAGADVLLVGDSLGMVVQGNDSTLPVTMDQMVYHCRAVSRGARRTWWVTCRSSATRPACPKRSRTPGASSQRAG